MGPIKTDVQIITSPFGEARVYKGKDIVHKGVDLRSIDFKTLRDFEVVAPESGKVLRYGQDKLGNFYMVMLGDVSGKVLKFIHIDNDGFEIGQKMQAGDFVGVCIVGGNSTSKHLHFETWDKKEKTALDPCLYFDEMKIQYKMKEKARV